MVSRQPSSFWALQDPKSKPADGSVHSHSKETKTTVPRESPDAVSPDQTAQASPPKQAAESQELPARHPAITVHYKSPGLALCFTGTVLPQFTGVDRLVLNRRTNKERQWLWELINNRVY